MHVAAKVDANAFELSLSLSLVGNDHDAVVAMVVARAVRHGFAHDLVSTAANVTRCGAPWMTVSVWNG